MLDLGWSEIFVIAVVAILVVGPRELPGMLRNIGKFMGQARRMANDFQRQFNDAIKEADLDDVKKDIEGVSKAASKITPAGLATSMASAASPAKSDDAATPDDGAKTGEATPDADATPIPDKPGAAPKAEAAPANDGAEPAATEPPQKAAS